MMLFLNARFRQFLLYMSCFQCQVLFVLASLKVISLKKRELVLYFDCTRALKHVFTCQLSLPYAAVG